MRGEAYGFKKSKKEEVLQEERKEKLQVLLNNPFSCKKRSCIPKRTKVFVSPKKHRLYPQRIIISILRTLGLIY